MKTLTSTLACAAALTALLTASAAPAATLPVTTDLELWLDANDFDGDGVAEGTGEDGLSLSGGQWFAQSWQDKSGLNNDAAHVSGKAPVLIVGAGPGGTDIVRYDGADQHNVAGFSVGGDVTIFNVFNPDGASGQLFNSNGSGVGGGNYITEVNAGSYRGRVFDGANQGDITTPVSAGTDYIGAYVYVDSAANGAAISLNGGVPATANTGAISTVTASAAVGSHPGGSSGFDGDVMEVIVYDRALSYGEQNAVGYYLEQKHGLDTAYHRNAININFALASNDNNSVDADETAGVEIQANGQLWNHVVTRSTTTSGVPDTFIANTTGGSSITLADSHGDSSAASLTSTIGAGGGFTNFANVSGGAVGATGDAGMFQSFLNFGGAAPSETITVSGLGGDFANGYDVYVYFEGNLDRTYGFTINGETIWGTDLFDNSDVNNDGIIEFARGIGTTSGTANSSNYVVFTSLSGSSFTLSAQTLGGRAVISGLQIVAVPAPAALPAGLALLALAAARRRRR